MDAKRHNETLEILAKVNPNGEVSKLQNRHARYQCHPVLIGLDALLRAAKVYEAKWGQKVADTDPPGVAWIEAANSFRAMLYVDFGPFDSSTGEAIYQKALEVAGIVNSTTEN